jgi:hypothetical protein
MRVEPIDKTTADVFVSRKHYSRKPSIFWEGFGLIEDSRVDGVVVFGQPSPPIQKHAFVNRDFRLYELSRLVVQSQNKNAASFLISHSLQMLSERPSAVISYADSAHSHCGIVYQATNWIYTGATTSHDKLYVVDGKPTHPMSLRDRGITNPTAWAKQNGIATVSPKPKHRYFYLIGNRKDKQRMLASLAYPIVKPYPKCDQSRYDDGPSLNISAKQEQTSLW